MQATVTAEVIRPRHELLPGTYTVTSKRKSFFGSSSISFPLEFIPLFAWRMTCRHIRHLSGSALLLLDVSRHFSKMEYDVECRMTPLKAAHILVVLTAPIPTPMVQYAGMPSEKLSSVVHPWLRKVNLKLARGRNGSMAPPGCLHAAYR